MLELGPEVEDVSYSVSMRGSSGECEDVPGGVAPGKE